MQITNNITEKELLHQIAADDAEAFEVMLNRYHGPCYETALTILQDEQQAKDIVQEVFLKVWLRRKKLEEVDNFGGWLRRITVNLIYDYIKRAKKEDARRAAWVRDMYLPETDEATTEEVEFEELINEALERLPAKQKEAFVLIKKEGRSREEAAAIQGVSAETIKTNLERAMRSIRAYCLDRLDDASLTVIFAIIFKNYL